MKVGEQAIYLAQLKGLKRAEAKRILEEWFEPVSYTHLDVYKRQIALLETPPIPISFVTNI